MDFVRNRQFRQTLLCRADAHPSRALTADVLHGCFLSSAVAADTPIDFTPGVTVTFTDGSRRAGVSAAATKAAFTILMQTWPRAVGFDELCARALTQAAGLLGGASAEEARAAMTTDLFGAVMYGVINLHTRQVSCASTLSGRPRALPVAAWLARTSDLVVNAHHAMVQLPASDLELLRLSTGERSAEDLATAMPESGSESGASATVAEGLARLLRHGLLAG